MFTTLFKKLFLYWFVLVIFGILFWDNTIYATSCIPTISEWVIRYELWTQKDLLQAFMSPYLYLYSCILTIFIASILQFFNKNFIPKNYIKILRYIILWIIILYFSTNIALGQNTWRPFNNDLDDCGWMHIFYEIYTRKDILPRLVLWFSITHLISWLLLVLHKYRQQKLTPIPPTPTNL